MEEWQEIGILAVLCLFCLIYIFVAAYVYYQCVWKEKKIAKEYPELIYYRKKLYSKLNNIWREYDQMSAIKDEIKAFEEEKIFLPKDILTQRKKDIELKKIVLYEVEPAIDKKLSQAEKEYVAIQEEISKKKEGMRLCQKRK